MVVPGMVEIPASRRYNTLIGAMNILHPSLQEHYRSITTLKIDITVPFPFDVRHSFMCLPNFFWLQIPV